ncbi:putative sporulation protein YtxC [Dehalobacterium formicoaceticum]|uniref:Sporulation protein YtxC n=1 Tax=Dehalobacterium formicoaceticum TaxID=51515 RepID=A0ABT1Y7H0_9FIRM|nr:putative sporulation protein YtxC [Dehalobacterium formicoaceticum]MCR6546832.1 putative sporulation protein YtxC [Dehalobacterium formicoaceticum]
MATSISIGTSKDADLIFSQLGKELSFLQEEGIDVLLEEKQRGSFTILDCSLPKAKKPEQELILRHYVANAVSDAILQQWEHSILRKITKNHYYYLSPEEKDKVLKKAKHILEAVSLNGDSNYLQFQLSRKNKILQQVLDYLTSNDQINIDGFIRFRLHDYQEDLNRVIQQAVDEMLLEKEYQEFIMLLKYFIEIQEPKLAKVHIYLLSSGSFQLFDDKNQPVNKQFLDGCIIGLIDNEINYEDLLITALVSIAPQEIMLHLPESAEIGSTLQTLEGVFGSRLEICHGCPRCNKNHPASH